MHCRLSAHIMGAMAATPPIPSTLPAGGSVPPIPPRPRLLDDDYEPDVWDDYWGPFRREMMSGQATRSGKPASPETIKNWEKAADQFHAWLLQNALPTDPTETTRDHIVGYAAYMSERGLAHNTIRGRLTTVKAFYRWLARTEQIAKSPAQNIRVPQPTMGAGEFPRDDAITALLAVCKPTKRLPPGHVGYWKPQFDAARDEAMLRLFLDTGVRLAGMLSLTWENLDLEERWAIVKWKGGYWRRIWLKSKTITALKRYLKLYKLHPQYEQAFINGPNGKPEHPVWLTSHGAMKPGGLRYAIWERCDQAGVKRWGIHSFRHRFGDHLKRSGLNDSEAMLIGGWSDPGSYRRYGRAAEQERLTEAYEQQLEGSDAF